MFVISISYKVPFDRIEPHLDAHMQFLDRHYASGHFLLSGRKVPRSGGVILARAGSKTEIQTIIEEDPFYSENLADFEIVEIAPSRAVPGLEILLE